MAHGYNLRVRARRARAFQRPYTRHRDTSRYHDNHALARDRSARRTRHHGPLSAAAAILLKPHVFWLPAEIMETIFVGLDKLTLFQLLLSCRVFYNIIRGSNRIWNSVIQHEHYSIPLPYISTCAYLVYTKLLFPYTHMLSLELGSWKFGRLCVMYEDHALVGFARLGPIREHLFRIELKSGQDLLSGQVRTVCLGSESNLKHHLCAISWFDLGTDQVQVVLKCMAPGTHRTVNRTKDYVFQGRTII